METSKEIIKLQDKIIWLEDLVKDLVIFIDQQVSINKSFNESFKEIYKKINLK
jgi:hypothetical protein